METIWKTAPLFVGELPPMGGNYPKAVRWHLDDMASLPVARDMPKDAWGGEHIWKDHDDAFRAASLADALTMARGGWPEGAEEARKLHEGVQAAMPQRRALARFDVAGAVPDIARAIAGNPASMRRPVVKETAQRPILTLVCDISVGSFTDPADMLRHATAVAGIVDFLEEAGFRCDVLTVARVANQHVGAEIAVRLKTADQPLNLSSLTYGLGHPAFFRRLMFCVWFGHAECSGLGPALGYASPAKAMPDAGTFTVPSAGNNTGDAAARFRVLLATLANQGCPGIPEEMHLAV